MPLSASDTQMGHIDAVHLFRAQEAALCHPHTLQKSMPAGQLKACCRPSV